MRSSFGYESNVLEIRQLLVPDHIGEDEWESIERDWRSVMENQTLMGYLAREWKQEGMLLDILGESLNIPICYKPVFPDENSLEPVEAMLLNHGLVSLRNPSRKRLLTGGETINPDLRKYLGEAAGNWQWVLVPPVDKDRLKGDRVHEAAPIPGERDFAAWLKNLLGGLWSTGTSDIHLENSYDGLVIRVQNAAQMKTIGTWRDGRASTVQRLICRWAGVSEWDHQSFVDGTLFSPGTNFPIRMRFSLIPTITGWSIVVRSPAPSLYARNLVQLGLSRDHIQLIMDTVRHENGLTLCTGTTGSGKTTTLYAILKELEQDNLKVITIEDPVEQELPHTVQSPVDTRNGWTFEKAVHSFLRQDPDIIMIGEIRDATSAEAACRAALTGHSVLSTMHAAETKMAVQRFSHWGIPHGIIKDTIRLVINQRLRTAPGSTKAIVEFRCEILGAQAAVDSLSSLHPADTHT